MKTEAALFVLYLYYTHTFLQTAQLLVLAYGYREPQVLQDPLGSMGPRITQILASLGTPGTLRLHGAIGPTGPLDSQYPWINQKKAISSQGP